FIDLILARVPLTPELYTLSLHDALPIFARPGRVVRRRGGRLQLRLRPVGGPRARLRAGSRRRAGAGHRRGPQPDRPRAGILLAKIGRAHVSTPVTFRSRMPSSA